MFLISLSLSIQLQEVAAAHFNVHEHYDDRTLENDICVVILAAPLRSNQSKIGPIFSFFKEFLCEVASANFPNFLIFERLDQFVASVALPQQEEVFSSIL